MRTTMTRSVTVYTLEPQTVHYKTISAIRRFMVDPKKCCIQTKMYRPYMYTFCVVKYGCLANTVLLQITATVL